MKFIIECDTRQVATIDEAIVLLGKIRGDVLVKPIGDAAGATQARKPRNDVGKKRGAYKPVAASPESASKQPDEQSVLDLTPVSKVAASETAFQQGVTDTKAALQAQRDSAPSAADAQVAMEKLFNAKGFEKAQGLLQEYKVPRVRDLPAIDRADFIADCEERLK